MKYAIHVTTNYPDDTEEDKEPMHVNSNKEAAVYISGHLLDKEATSWVITVVRIRK